MGYTHYWYRKRAVPEDVFDRILDDFNKLLPSFKVLDIKLGDARGEGEPVLTHDEITFNGLVKCGHKENKAIVIPWPAAETKPGVAPDSSGAIEGSWFAGVVLNQRTCDGNCSYETFDFPRFMPKEDFEQYEDNKTKERIFQFCKTAYRPYDLAVTAFLIIAKHYMKGDIHVLSDGEWKDWLDAAQICQNALGYGINFKLKE
jgi:hypothetical protein